MARAISDEELQLKKRARRRLVGAIVLVTVVAVVLPMVLDSEPRQVTQNVEIDIPPSGSSELKPKAAGATRSTADNVPLKGMPPPTSAKGEAGNTVKAEVPSRIDDPAVVPESASNKDSGTQAAKEGTKPKAAATDQKSATETSKAVARDSAGTYVVQVAALADEVRAKALQKQMTDAGIKTYTEVVATKSGEVTRVRAGPYATREAAESARTQLKKAGLDGTVAAK